MAELVVLAATNYCVLRRDEFYGSFDASVVRAVVRREQNIRWQMSLEVIHDALPAIIFAVTGKEKADLSSSNFHDDRGVVARVTFVRMRAKHFELQLAESAFLPSRGRVDLDSGFLHFLEDPFYSPPVVGCAG
jgi:hypothetical protein